MGIHQAASSGYNVAARAYEAARPAYPAAAVRLVGAATASIGGRALLDVGAGTGKWTRGLVTLGLPLVAVEPVAAMRDILRRSVPEASVVAGEAEALPVAAQSVDLVTVAQAVHWFRLERAIPEIHRVLRAGAHVAVVNNQRDRSVAWVAAMDELLEPHRGTVPNARRAPWRHATLADGRFELVADERIPNPEEFDADRLVERVASLSFVGAMPAGERGTLLAQIRTLADDLPESFAMPYTTEVVLFRRRPEPTKDHR